MTRNIAQILKVRINSTPLAGVLSQILTFVASPRLQGSKPLVVFTPNPEFLVAASRNQAFRHLLNQSDINVPDGFGLIWLSRFLGQPLAERVSGADLVAELLSIGSEKKWAVGIAGARRGDEEESTKVIDRLKEIYPGLTIVNLDKTKLGTGKFEIVLACHGMGKQERWIMENKNRVQAKVFIGIGGALDFLTGFARRAPRWMQQTGFEWLWRALQRPGHLKRVWTAVVVFPYLAIKEELSQRT
jgi:N-acetylglucosaminyldiphosphoundecaprenol N-acetyl-beta-D-mannosaminyltransferase